MAYGKHRKKQFEDESEDSFIAPKKTVVRYHGDAESEAPSSERMETKIELTSEQQEAFVRACDWQNEPLGSKLFTLGGYAGTGKTTLTAELAKQWVFNGNSVGFCTFTWKAAQVLKRKLRAVGVDACPTSLHGLMYIPVTDTKGNIIRWRRRPSIDYSIVIVDESSMLTEQLMDDLLDYGVKVLAVGDHAQLPPIDGPSVLTSLDAELTQVCRQAQDSPIVRLATHVRLEGDLGRIPDGISVMDDDDEIQRVRADDVAQYGELDVATLTYTNRSRVTANHYIRSYLQRQGAPSPGDVVMCLSNQPPLFNGMRGLVSGTSFQLQRDHWYLGTVDFPDDKVTAIGSFVAKQFDREKSYGNTVELGQDLGQPIRALKDAGLLADYGYAMTVHKAQGSEYKSVYLLYEKPRRVDLDGFRKWLYTAITRAEKKLTILY